ncbi:MAG: hypothetical protein J5843_03440 [Clostridia bacterium]|nr:hypothetical protein [Clostridia bacterium]
MKRKITAYILAALLCAAAILPALTGCSSENPEAQASGGTGGTEDAAAAKDAGENTAEAVETEAPELRSKDLLPAADFGGAEFLILGREYAKLGSLPSVEFAVDEMNGEIINDTVYKRNRTVEDNFNVRIRAMTGAAASLVPTSVAAGDGAYDLAWAHVNDMAALSTGGNLANYCETPHINLSGAWWNQLAVESLTVNGKCFLQMNYIPFTGVMLSHALFYNQNILNNYGLTAPTEYVNRNEWTFDNFRSMAESVSSDENGDGTWDENDLYGLLSSHGTSGQAMSIAMGVRPVEISADGEVSLTLVSDRNQSILEALVSLTHSPSSWLITDYSKENDLAKMFVNGRGLFYSGFLTDAYQFFRDMEADYGLSVFPKWEASDERYITTVTGGTGLLGIPAVTADAERTGLITEALAIESYYDVYPAVFETVINDKLLRDEDSQKMFRLLMDGLEVSLARTYKYAAYNDLFADLTASGSTDLASAAAKQEKPALKHYEKVIQSFGG